MAPNSSDVVAGNTGFAAEYNNLRKDVLDITSGHDHSGAADHGKRITDIFGTFVSKNLTTQYTAECDGILIATGSGAGATSLALRTELTPGSGLITILFSYAPALYGCGGSIPVKKGCLYTVVSSTGCDTPVIYWLPISS